MLLDRWSNKMMKTEGVTPRNSSHIQWVIITKREICNTFILRNNFRCYVVAESALSSNVRCYQELNILIKTDCSDHPDLQETMLQVFNYNNFPTSIHCTVNLYFLQNQSIATKFTIEHLQRIIFHNAQNVFRRGCVIRMNKLTFTEKPIILVTYESHLMSSCTSICHVFKVLCCRRPLCEVMVKWYWIFPYFLVII